MCTNTTKESFGRIGVPLKHFHLSMILLYSTLYRWTTPPISMITRTPQWITSVLATMAQDNHCGPMQAETKMTGLYSESESYTIADEILLQNLSQIHLKSCNPAFWSSDFAFEAVHDWIRTSVRKLLKFQRANVVPGSDSSNLLRYSHSCVADISSLLILWLCNHSRQFESSQISTHTLCPDAWWLPTLLITACDAPFVELTGLMVFTNCPVCVSSFTWDKPLQPVTLQCGHTFCRGCLKLLRCRLCPHCRTRFTGDPALLAPTYVLRDVIEDLPDFAEGTGIRSKVIDDVI